MFFVVVLFVVVLFVVFLLVVFLFVVFFIGGNQRSPWTKSGKGGRGKVKSQKDEVSWMRVLGCVKSKWRQGCVKGRKV